MSSKQTEEGCNSGQEQFARVQRWPKTTSGHMEQQTHEFGRKALVSTKTHASERAHGDPGVVQTKILFPARYVQAPVDVGIHGSKDGGRKGCSFRAPASSSQTPAMSHDSMTASDRMTGQGGKGHHAGQTYSKVSLELLKVREMLKRLKQECDVGLSQIDMAFKHMEGSGLGLGQGDKNSVGQRKSTSKGIKESGLKRKVTKPNKWLRVKKRSVFKPKGTMGSGLGFNSPGHAEPIEAVSSEEVVPTEKHEKVAYGLRLDLARLASPSSVVARVLSVDRRVGSAAEEASKAVVGTGGKDPLSPAIEAQPTGKGKAMVSSIIRANHTNSSFYKNDIIHSPY